MMVWAEQAGDDLVAASRHAPVGPVCVLGTSTDGTAVTVVYCRVTAKAHEDVLAVLAPGAPKTGRAVARALGIAPTTANARLGDLLRWGMVQSRAEGRSILWSLIPA